MSTLKAIAMTGTLCLTLVLPRSSLAESPREHDRREREMIQARERREHEIERGERSKREIERGEQERARIERQIEELEQQFQREYGERRGGGLEAEIDRLVDEIQELRAREIDLRAAQQTMNVEEDWDEYEQLTQALVHLRHDIERRQLELHGLEIERSRQTERRELMRMTERLEYVSNWRDVAFGPQEAVMMATQAIVELHVMIDEPEAAAHALEKLLQRVDELGTRTAIRFALKDVYAEMGDRGAAVAGSRAKRGLAAPRTALGSRALRAWSTMAPPLNSPP